MEARYIKEYIEKTTGEKIDVKSRKRNIVYSKAVFSKLCRMLVVVDDKPLSYAKIGKMIHSSHANVMHLNKNVFDIALAYSDKYKELFDNFFINNNTADGMITLEKKYAVLKDEYNKLRLDHIELYYRIDKMAKRNPITDLISSVPEDRIDLLEERLIPIVKMLNNARFN